MKIKIIFLGGYFSAVIVDNFQLVHTTCGFGSAQPPVSRAMSEFETEVWK
jgi:hypothetical protein